jgi:hypothetical protein
MYAMHKNCKLVLVHRGKCLIIVQFFFGDFEVCFLVPLDSSDIATPDGTGSFCKKKLISCRIFYFSGLGTSSFRCERISTQRATTAHFVAPVRERQRNGVQIGLQCNVITTIALTVSRLGYHSLTGAHF